MSQESKPPGQNHEEEEKQQYTLKQLLLFITGVSVVLGAVHWTRKLLTLGDKKIFLRYEWLAARKSLNRPPRKGHSAAEDLLKEIERARERVEQHNKTAPWWQEKIQVNEVMPRHELVEALQAAAQHELISLQTFPLEAVRKGNREAVKDCINQLQRFPRLAAAGNLTIEELFQEQNVKEWQRILGKLAAHAAQNCFDHLETSGKKFAQPDWELLRYFLNLGNLDAIGPDVGIPPDRWEKIEREFGKPGEKSQEGNTGQAGPGQAEPIAAVAAHTSILRRLAQNFRDNALTANTIIPSVEAVILMTSIIFDYNPFAPGVFSGIYLGSKLGIKLSKKIWAAFNPSDRTPTV